MVLTPEVNDLINKILLAILTGIMGYVLPMAYRVFRAWAEAKIAKSRAEVAAISDQEERARAEAKLRLVEYSFERLDHIVNNTVDQVSQQFVKQSGLTDMEKKERLASAFLKVKKQLPEDIKNTLGGVVNDLDKYLITKIEAARFKQKRAGAANESAADRLIFEKQIEASRIKQGEEKCH